MVPPEDSRLRPRGVPLAAVVELVHVFHSLGLLRVVVDVQAEGRERGEQLGVLPDEAEVRLAVEVAEVVHHAGGDADGGVAAGREEWLRAGTGGHALLLSTPAVRRVELLLIVRGLVPCRLGLHPPREPPHHLERLVGRLHHEHAGVAREDAVGGRALAKLVAVPKEGKSRKFSSAKLGSVT